MLGLVLNKVPSSGPDSYSYYREGYAPESPRQNAKQRKALTKV